MRGISRKIQKRLGKGGTYPTYITGLQLALAAELKERKLRKRKKQKEGQASLSKKLSLTI